MKFGGRPFDLQSSKKWPKQRSWPRFSASELIDINLWELSGKSAKENELATFFCVSAPLAIAIAAAIVSFLLARLHFCQQTVPLSVCLSGWLAGWLAGGQPSNYELQITSADRGTCISRCLSRLTPLVRPKVYQFERQDGRVCSPVDIDDDCDEANERPKE